MRPELGRVLATLAHEIRTPLSISQGYVKLMREGRLTDPDEARRALDRTQQALAGLATYCADMSRISDLAESAHAGIPERMTVAELLARVRVARPALSTADWSGTESARVFEGRPIADVVEALATVLGLPFDHNRGQALGLHAGAGDALTIVAGADSARIALQEGPDSAIAAPVDMTRGGKGLTLIWAAFVLDKHGAQAWTLRSDPASVGIRLRLLTT